MLSYRILFPPRIGRERTPMALISCIKYLVQAEKRTTHCVQTVLFSALAVRPLWAHFFVQLKCHKEPFRYNTRGKQNVVALFCFCILIYAFIHIDNVNILRKPE